MTAPSSSSSAPIRVLATISCVVATNAHQVSVAISGSHGDHHHADVMEELVGPCAVIAAALVCSAGVVAWLLSSGRQAEKAPAQALLQRTAAQRAALWWLGALVAVSVLLLFTQVVLGVLCHSLTLVADSAHAGADAVTYGFAYLVELAKTRVGSRLGRPGAAARLDALSALFSAVLIIGTSLYTSVDALRRLTSGAVVEPHGVDRLKSSVGAEDVHLIGPALLGFAVASTVANCGLLLLHRMRLQAVASEQGGPPPPAVAPPPPLAKFRFLPPQAPHAAVEHVPPPPPPPPPPAVAEGDRGRLAARREQRRLRPPPAPREKLAWLHAAFHPGCDLSGGCQSSSCGPPAGAATATVPEATQAEENLNVYGALLHLVTDVLRSVVIFVAGVLVQCKLLGDAERADAACSLVVSACVVCGSAALLRGAAPALRGAVHAATQARRKASSAPCGALSA